MWPSAVVARILLRERSPRSDLVRRLAETSSYFVSGSSSGGKAGAVFVIAIVMAAIYFLFARSAQKETRLTNAIIARLEGSKVTALLPYPTMPGGRQPRL